MGSFALEAGFATGSDLSTAVEAGLPLLEGVEVSSFTAGMDFIELVATVLWKVCLIYIRLVSEEMGLRQWYIKILVE